MVIGSGRQDAGGTGKLKLASCGFERAPRIEPMVHSAKFRRCRSALQEGEIWSWLACDFFTRRNTQQ